MICRAADTPRALDRAPACERLPASSCTTHARGSVERNGGVPKLTVPTRRTSCWSTLVEQRNTDPGPNRHHCTWIRITTCTNPTLRDRGSIGII